MTVTAQTPIHCIKAGEGPAGLPRATAGVPAFQGKWFPREDGRRPAMEVAAMPWIPPVYCEVGRWFACAINGHATREEAEEALEAMERVASMLRLAAAWSIFGKSGKVRRR